MPPPASSESSALSRVQPRCTRVQSGQGLVTQKNISLATAKAIAEAAMDKCTALDFNVSVVVIDSAGLPLVMLRGDGAGLHTPEGAEPQGLHRAHLRRLVG